MADLHDEVEHSMGLFEDPPDFYPPSPKATLVEHTMRSGRVLALRLVGHNPLWGHHLWNAGRVVADYLELQAGTIHSRSVLELGAGAGLPSLVCALLGASTVVVTDYPDPDLVSNLQHNVDQMCLEDTAVSRRVVVEGYAWGADVSPLISHLISDPPRAPPTEGHRFDVVILADLLFNHSEHGKLLNSVQQTLSKTPDAKALVFFTPYRPWLLDKDLAFFDLARASGFLVVKVLEEKMEKVMFEEDPGDEDLRRTVFGYVLTRSSL